ncbi:hemagglutinin repeat-containing protein [Acetobacter indonesiensis]|uniref:Uncharacterized protein n=1 Tax=Acetobacter indonesiensis TaxID=104101 RepID=A0A252AJZ4_9PROT|nr:hemagglutinin repeat-containing protein [Acetobacter indonesiensis]OUI89870.1 hypothetical protein HK17_15310 [Acetobacter indonesiensis]
MTTSSSTAVDTTIKAGNSVTLGTPSGLTLDGAEVTGPCVDVSAGSLSIISPQNTSDYKSTARQAGAEISIPVWGAGGKTSGGASYSQQNVTDHFASTEDQLSGLYAGDQGLGVDVAGNTTLKAGVIESMADAGLNHFSTGSLTTSSVENISRWQATQQGGSFSGGAGMMGSTTGILGSVGTGLASGASGLMGGGRTHEETSESQSAIGGNIKVDAGSISGHYTTDVTAANAALKNMFDAQKLSNQILSQQMGSQLVGEVGGQISDQLNSLGIAGFGEKGVENSYNRIALETAANALIAAVTGGNIGSAAAGMAAGGSAVSASLNSVAGWVLDQTDNNVETAAPLVTAIENIIASGAGAAGGVARGGGKTASINALNGASQASAVEQYNAGAGDILKVVAALAKSWAAQVAKDALLNTLKGEGTTVAKGAEKEAGSAENLESAAGDV